MRTKGALLWESNTDWSIEQIELDGPRDGEVTVELAASGLCHSDEHVRTGDDPPAFFPVLGGHEAAGVVTEVAPGVRWLREGDHVVTAFIPSCGRCRYCASGSASLCELAAKLYAGSAISDDTYRIRARGQKVLPLCLLGTFAPYMTAHEASLVKIDPEVPMEVAALLGCGVTTGWASATRAAEVRVGDTVVVLGAGGVGLNSVQGAVAAGARFVVAVDPTPAKRSWALAFGATHACSSADEAVTVIDDLTGGHMADKSIVAVGNTGGIHVQQALSVLGKGGTCVVAGLGRAGVIDVPMDLFDLTVSQKQIKGSLFGCANPQSEIPQLISLYRDGRLRLDELATAKYRLEDINAGYAAMRSGENARGLIVYNAYDRA